MFTFAQRLLIALFVLVAIGLLFSPLLFWNAAGVLVAIVIQLGAAWGLYWWLQSFVAEEHGYFLEALKSLHSTLESGNRGLVLKSERPPDSFGLLADEINDLVEATADRISQQLAINRELEQNKALFESILGAMIEGVLVLDGQRRILYFNAAARLLLNCRDRNPEGRLLWEVLRSSELQASIESVFDSGTECRQEVELQRNHRVVELTATQLPLRPAPGVLAVLHEVTELRGLERMRREFVSNVSHELKTPLTSIQVYADTLLDGGLADEAHNRKFVERILEQSDRLQTLIQEMLRLARIESQSEAFELRTVSLSKILKTCVDARMAVARSRNLELKLIPGADADVVADAGGLQTVFDNLISNSLNYTSAGGHVEVRWFLRDQQAVVEIRDDGIGISEEHRERIFERFYRVDRARSQGVGGTGLGLAIVKHLVAVFGGGIEVESVVGSGSIFRVRLPLAGESSEASEAAGQPAPSGTESAEAF